MESFSFQENVQWNMKNISARALWRTLGSHLSVEHYHTKSTKDIQISHIADIGVAEKLATY